MSRLLPDEVLAGFTPDELLSLTSRLVAVSSVSGQEKEVMDLARAYLEERGVRVEIRARDPGRPNLVATIGSGRPVLVVNGHLDTVPVSDAGAWQTDPLVATRHGERLHGLGSVDMKGPCAVMMLLAARLNRHRERLNGTLQLQLVCDEEDGCYHGTVYLIEEMKAGRLPRPDMVLSGEYSRLKLMNAERGSFKFQVVFHGRPTHTATARVEGINPIVHAARAVVALERPLPRFHPEVGYGVISVNMIKGGTFASQVPGDCTLIVDRRMLPGETDATSLLEAEEMIREALRDYPEARFQLEPLMDKNGRKRYSPPAGTAWTSRIVQAMARAHQAVTGATAEPFVDWFGVTDGRLFRYEGIETVAYGPHGEHFHGPNEYVDFPSLITQLRTFVTATLDLIG